LTVYQNGRGNTAISTQDGAYNRTVIGQNGRWNSADTSQRGRHNIVGVGQFGAGHTVVATQDGSGNAVGVIQAGRNNHATSTQVGAGNVAVHSRPRNVAVDGPQAERREPLNEFASLCPALAPRHRQTPTPLPSFWCHLFVPLSQQSERAPVTITKKSPLGVPLRVCLRKSQLRQ
jgi:VCBS repeat-containing protein